MSLKLQLTALAQAIAADVKSLKATDGSLSALTTTAKTSLVAAINEVQAALASAGGASILDTATTGDTSHTWSANKLVAQFSQMKSDIIAGAPAAYDTLLEISNKLGSDDTALASLLTAVGNRVSFDAAQSLTSAQQLQACSNLGIGDPDHDFVADYTTAKG